MGSFYTKNGGDGNEELQQIRMTGWFQPRMDTDQFKCGIRSREWRKRCRLVLALLNRYEFKAEDTIDLQTAEDHFFTSKPVHLPDYTP